MLQVLDTLSFDVISPVWLLRRGQASVAQRFQSTHLQAFLLPHLLGTFLNDWGGGY